MKTILDRITQTITQFGDEIIGWGEDILHMPELGYCEKNTSEYIRKKFEELGLECSKPLGITGVKATLHGKTDGINVCIIGEMDALKCNGNPHANADGVAHACGHNAQIASMLGAAKGLIKSGIMDELSGSITFFAVPAEEFIELDYRKKLRSNGQIKYFGGKQQLIAEGAFDDIDMAMMIHAHANDDEAKVYVRGYNLGFLTKTITIKGKASHGSTPHLGTNALNAAALAIIGIHSNRETFTENDKIRIHPIITKGGDVVNSVPDEVCIDTYVRGSSIEAIRKGNNAVNRSVAGASQIIGTRYESEDIPGYLPLCESVELSAVFEENASMILGHDNLIYNEEVTGSTDMGDLSMIMPVIQPMIGGFGGNLHSVEFTVTNKETAYVTSAKLLATTAAELLFDDCKKAKKVLDSFVPKMTKEDYLEYLEGKLYVD